MESEGASSRSLLCVGIQQAAIFGKVVNVTLCSLKQFL